MRMIAFLLLLIPLACSPEARWPQERPLQLGSPDSTPVAKAIATALIWWMDRDPQSSGIRPLPLYLAPELQPVSARLKKILPSFDMTDSDGSDVVAVRAVRMHHSSAQVDLDVPHQDRGRQLLTVDMQKFALTPWEVTGANWWRFNDRQLHRITQDAINASQNDESTSSEDGEQTTAEASEDQ